MAEPIEFQYANAKWTGEGDVGDLPVYRNGTENISCWHLTMEERMEILSTGVIWLHVWGDHPAVGVSISSPFIAESQATE